jgi:metallo-beta-lactamase class B
MTFATRFCAAMLAIAATALPAGAQTQREKWNAPMEPFHIIDNVYYVGTAGLASYLFVTPDGNILLDGALPESVPQIEANIAKLGFRLQDIKWILNSHAHFDHSGGLAQLKIDTGAKLAAMEGDVSALEGGVYLGSESVTAMSAPPVKVDRILHPGDTVELGELRLTANLTPGHTRGCTSWGATVHDAGKPLNLLVFCSATVAANRLYDPPQYDGIVADYHKTLAAMKQQKVDVFLAPHPEFYDMKGKLALQQADPDGPNRFVVPGEFTKFILLQERQFEIDRKKQEDSFKAKTTKPAAN